MYRLIAAADGRRFPRRSHMLRAFFLTLASLSCCAAFCNDSISWHKGTAYHRALREPISVYWPDSPIRDALMRLSKETRVAIFLDRRIDPGMTVDFRPDDVAPMAELLKDFAATQNLGVASIGSVVYIGPQATAQKIPTLLKMRRDELRKLPRMAVQRFAQRRAPQWETLATPQQLLAEIEQETGVQISGQELVPHDIWPATSLPELSFSERMTLVLAGFNLTYTFADGEIRLMPIPKKMTIARRDNGRVVKQTVVPGEKRFTLTIKNQPVGPVMKTLSARLNFELMVDDSAGNKLDELISLDVKEVTRDELLRAVLKPAGLSFRMNGTTVVVFTGE